MRPETIARAAKAAQQEPLPAVAMEIDGIIWAWLEDRSLFMKLAEHVPAKFLVKPSPGDVAFIRAADKAPNRGPALPVERGDFVSIGGIRFEDEELVNSIEKSFGGVTWHAWDEWILARDGQRKLVAVWKLPEGHGVMDVFAVEFDGDPWVTDGRFAIRMCLAGDARAKLLKQVTKGGPHAKTFQEIRDANSASGADAKPDRRDGGSSMVGEAKVPTSQLALIEKSHGAKLEWRWTGANEPVVAWKGKVAVGIIMPISPTAGSSEPSGG